MRKRLRVNVTSSNNRLFVGNIPKTRSREELLSEFQKHTGWVVRTLNVISLGRYASEHLMGLSWGDKHQNT